MSIRQYIGARYVPKFFENPNNTSEWLPNVEYEPLTIVTFGANTYTSKKFVPASVGNPSLESSKEYWVATANFNAYIEELQSQIDDINNEITNINDDRIIVIADSYGTTIDNITPFTELLPSMIGKTIGVDYFYNAMGGASWKGIGNRPSFLTVLQNIENVVTSPETIDKILVFGGVNDAIGAISDIYNGANAFMTYVKTQYPNAKVFTSMIGWNRDEQTKTNIINVSYAGYSNLGAFGIGVIPNGIMMMHDYRSFLADGTHPSASSQNSIAYAISSFLNGGSLVYNGRAIENTTVSLNTNLFQSGTLTFSESHTDDMINVTWSNADLAFASGATLGYDALFTIGTKESVYWERNTNVFSASIKMSAKLVYNDGTYHSVPVELVVFNDHGTIKAYPIMDHAYNNIANPSYLSIIGGCANLSPLNS